MRSILISLAAALVLVQSAVAVTDGDRTEVYREFRSLFDARKYQEALPVAEKLVALTEEQYSQSDRALANPLNNLATTAYRLKDYPTAEKNYLRAVEILDATAGGAERQLLRPLHGLGATYVAMNQYADAIPPLKRAVDLSRNLDGLFNVDQIAYLEPLITSYVALELNAEAEKEHQYVLHVAEDAFGKSDVRMLQPLDRYARWLENAGRYTSARAQHARALALAQQKGGKGSLLMVVPLQGIARTYRLEFLNGSEAPGNDAFTSDTGTARADASNTQRLNEDGERALRLAMQAIDRAQPVDHRLRGTTLVELGDWYLSGGAGTKALEMYRAAWKDLAQVNATAPLETPRLIAYRPPSSSLKRSQLDPDSAELHYVEVKFTVTTDGRTAGVTTVATDAPDAIQKTVMTSVKKARYSPRFENGEPVETAGVTMRERLLLRKQEQRDKGKYERST
jgi:hypothetical protein